jgi:fatty acid desaturase
MGNDPDIAEKEATEIRRATPAEKKESRRKMFNSSLWGIAMAAAAYVPFATDPLFALAIAVLAGTVLAIRGEHTDALFRFLGAVHV